MSQLVVVPDPKLGEASTGSSDPGVMTISILPAVSVFDADVCASEKSAFAGEMKANVARTMIANVEIHLFTQTSYPVCYNFVT